MRVLASLRRLPRYPLEVFFGTRLLIWGATILAYLVFEAQYAQPLHTGRRRGRRRARRRLGDRRLGPLGQRLVPRDRAARLRRPGPLLRVLPAVPAARPRASAGSCSATTCSPAFSSRWPPRPSRSCCSGSSTPASSRASRRRNRSVLYLAIFPTTLFLFAVYSESLYLAADGRRVPARAFEAAGGGPASRSGSRR